MNGGFLLQALIFMAGAIICVPLAKKLGLSSVLGYLLAGILIGPYVFGFIGEGGEDIMHFAEFGVVIMLFLIGLEIEPRNFWKMRKTILGMGGAQLVITLGMTYLLFRLLDYSWNVSLVIGMAVVLSSTAIVLQTLKEKGLMNTSFGSSSFSILLFQDIIVIPMLAVVPLLSHSSVPTVETEEHILPSFLENLPIPLQAAAIIFSIAMVIVAGRYLFVPMLRLVAQTKVRELLVGAALLIVVGLALLMELVGLSHALGAFLGGVVLATSEYKHELESNLEPFKGLLLGLFFMAVGASINFIIISDNPLFVFSLVTGIVALKALILFAVGTIFKMKLDQKLLLSIGLAQVGEFAFVLLAFAFQLNILSQGQMDIMLVVTALSMTIAPVLNLVNERLILPNVGTKRAVHHRDMDHIAKTHKVILIGFGHFGSNVGRFLRSHGIEATILDNDSNRVDLLRKMGFEVYYGDATRLDLLESAGIARARFLISTIGNPDVNVELARVIQEKYPEVKLMMRAKGWYDAYEMLNLGIENVYRESLETSVKLASDVLTQIGFRKYTIHRQAQNFIRYDQESIKRLAETRTNSEEYIFQVRKEVAQQERLLEEDLKRGLLLNDDHQWDSQMRAVDKE